MATSCCTGVADCTLLDGVRVTVAVLVAELCDFTVLPVEYRSFLWADAVAATAINAMNNTDFFITVSFCDFFPPQK